MNVPLEPSRYTLASCSTRDYDGSTKLWRYLTFEKFAWLLEKSKLWHTRLDFLGDPFEGSFTKMYADLRDTGKLPTYLQCGLPPETEKSRNRATPYSYFATCWYESAYESAAMWKLYSSEHAGIAIISTPQRMYDSVDLAPYGSGILSPVEYLDFDADDMLLRPLAKSHGRRPHPALLKRKSFAHENEVRGLINWTDYSRMPPQLSISNFSEAIRNANPPGIAVSANLKILISGIYVSPLAPNYFREVVEIMAARHELSDRIRISALSGKPSY